MRAIDTLRTALKAIIEEEGLAWPVKTVIEPPRDAKHGDLSVNSAMIDGLAQVFASPKIFPRTVQQLYVIGSKSLFLIMGTSP
jgi:Arginyl-tRNA synthetase